MKNVPRKYDYITFIPATIDGQYAMSIKSFYKTLKTHSVALNNFHCSSHLLHCKYCRLKSNKQSLPRDAIIC